MFFMKAGRERGFTLIELSVVITIVLILAALLVPVFTQAKVAAKKANDLMNLKPVLRRGVARQKEFYQVFIEQVRMVGMN